jgi:hypothetical protein
VVRPLLHHIELGYLTTLDTIGTNESSDGIWTRVEIGLGRHRDNFKVVFSLLHTGGPYRAGVAVDEVDFFGCQTPLPVEADCPATEEPYFHCTISKACIKASLLCDWQDDCGDNSDEIAEGAAACHNYQKTNFEDPKNPLGLFTQEVVGLQWSWGNGTTQNEGTGPPFDHTMFNPYGHYLFIGSDKGGTGEYARLWSKVIRANQPR